VAGLCAWWIGGATRLVKPVAETEAALANA
jgi:hypothetical protein